MSQIFIQNRAVQAGRWSRISRVAATFRTVLHLYAVFADDADISIFLPHRPRASLHIQSAEFAEAVGGEEYLCLCCHRSP